MGLFSKFAEAKRAVLSIIHVVSGTTPYAVKGDTSGRLVATGEIATQASAQLNAAGSATMVAAGSAKTIGDIVLTTSANSILMVKSATRVIAKMRVLANDSKHVPFSLLPQSVATCPIKLSASAGSAIGRINYY